ncbi:hypothetical protein [Natrialba sp. PRR66]|uniref:hypothetical protein n=1 Tax=Natrialba sp. PRR66 TaxID=3098146 RepID=UPI002B1E3F15|nr:hypothetical protein [Natrialba sp. PRR66]
MQRSAQKSLNSDEWTTISDFGNEESANSVSKYEAKFIANVEKQYIENEIVLVKETRSMGGEQLYHIPKTVFEGIVDQLPAQ